MIYLENPSPDKSPDLLCQQIHEKLKRTLAKIATFDSIPELKSLRLGEQSYFFWIIQKRPVKTMQPW